MIVKKLYAIMVAVLCVVALCTSPVMGMDEESSTDESTHDPFESSSETSTSEFGPDPSEVKRRQDAAADALEAHSIIKTGLPANASEGEKAAFEELQKALEQTYVDRTSGNNIFVFLSLMSAEVDVDFILDTTDEGVDRDSLKKAFNSLKEALNEWKEHSLKRSSTPKLPTPPSHTPTPAKKSFARTLGKGALFTTVTGAVGATGYYLYTSMQERVDSTAEDDLDASFDMVLDEQPSQA